MSTGIEIRGFLTNLGKYNDGEIVGIWVTLPMTDSEVDAAMKKIGVSDEPDADGFIYDEYFWSDWECDADINIYDILGEHTSIDEANEFAESVEDIDPDQLSASLEFFSSTEEALVHIDEMVFIGETDTYGKEAKVVGEYYFYDVYNEGKRLPEHIINRYLDFESLGKELRAEYDDSDDAYENAGDYYCGDPDATNEEIGESFVDDNGVDAIDNLIDYFDVEGWGRDIMLEGSFVVVNHKIWEHQD